MSVRHPPGRAGRIWLRERLATATHSAGLLERKHEALGRERRRLAALVDQTARDWEGAHRSARTALLHVLLLDGRPTIERSHGRPSSARAVIRWQTTMGVTYPTEAACELDDDIPSAGPAAVPGAIDAYRAATTAAVHHAAATAALARVDADLEGTGRRLRAIRDRLIPQLHEASRQLELALDETERENMITMHSHLRNALDTRGEVPP